MADRRIVVYEEERNEHGPHWTLTVERSSSGDPCLFFIIKEEMHDPKYAHLNREMCVVVEDADKVLAPAMEWLKTRRAEKDALEWANYDASMEGDR